MNSVSVRESVRRFSEDDLKFLHSRLSQKLCGDCADAVEVLSRVSELDKWLRSASSANELFDMVDTLFDSIKAEYNRRWKRED